MSNIVTTEDLKLACGCKQQSQLIAYLEGNNIRYFNSKNGPWTTIGLIEAAKGLINGQDFSDKEQEPIL